MQTLLVLSYHFPPFGGVAVQRMLRFVRYLPEQHIQPVVLCAQPPRASSVPLDPKLLQQLPPKLEVIRLTPWEPERFHNHWSHPWDKIRRNAMKWISAWLVPDDQALWIEPAVAKLLELAAHRQVMAILATGPPFSTLVAAAEAARRTGLPLVVDFRDDWTGLRRRRGDYSSSRQRQEEVMEAKVLAQASAVLTVTPQLVQELAQRSPHPERVHLLCNGYDPAHFGLPATQGDGCLFSAGSLYAGREPGGFFEAWGQFRRERPQSRLRFELAGPVAANCQGYFSSRLHSRWLGFLPHAEVCARLQQAQANLVWLDPGLADQAYTGKLLEYLGAGRPVLMLGSPQSQAAQLLQQSGLGRTYANDDIAAIVTALKSLDDSDQGPTGKPEVIAAFDARQQVAQLAQILHKTCIVTPSSVDKD